MIGRVVASVQVDVIGVAAARVVSQLYAATFDDPWTHDDVVKVLATPGAFALVATVEAGEEPAPCGFAIVRTAGGESELLAIGVLPTARRCGVGRALLSVMERYILRQGAHAIFLEVAEDNMPARELYQAQGFQDVGRRQAYYRRAVGRMDAVVMRLKCASRADHD